MVDKESVLKKPLKTMTVSEEVFKQILDGFVSTAVEDLTPYQYGYPDKYMIYTDGRDLICLRRKLVVLGLLEENYMLDDWYQIYCHMEIEQEEKIIDGERTSPAQAVKKINNIIKKHYTNEEKIEIFHKHENDKSTILHKTPISEFNKIYLFHDCYYYDANGAYASELIKLFPKCQDDLTYMFKHRHDNNNKFKNCFNYYVGCLTQNDKKREYKIAHNQKVREIYPKTRHYIVDNITRKMQLLIDELDSKYLIYVNTDGLIAKSPTKIREHSTDIGEFKIEYQGDVYTYRDKNYIIIQYGDEIKGNLPLELRKHVDLRIGKVVHYDRYLDKYGLYRYMNIEEEIINGKEEID